MPLSITNTPAIWRRLVLLVEETGVPGYKNRHQHHLIQNNLITYYRNDVAQKFSNAVKQLSLKHLNIGYISFKNYTVNNVTYPNLTITLET